IGSGNPVTHPYQQVGTYSVSLIITDAVGCMDTIAQPDLIDIFNPIDAPLQVATVENDFSDSLTWSMFLGPDFSHYVIYRENPTGSNNFTAIDSLFNLTDTTYLDFGINTLTNPHCYKVQVVDGCGRRSDLLANRTHCTMDLSAAPGLDMAILNWTPYIGWDSIREYNVYKVTSYDTLGLWLGTVPSSVLTFTDSTAVCYQLNSYRIEAIEAGGWNQISWSDTACTIPIHIPPNLPQEMVHATVENNQEILVEWLPPTIPDVTEFYLERSLDNVTYSPLATIPFPATQYVDNNVNVQTTSYYYRMRVLDECGDFTPYSRHARSIVLDADNPMGVITLNWNPYTDWAGGVDQYEVEVLNPSTGNWTIVGTVPGTVTTFIDDITPFETAELCYRVRAIESGGNLSFSLSNEDCVLPNIWVPNTITPNGDG
ncbi:MAG: fibronectin type III domain-containing protein, partial [Bacteroidota bacterium]